jgi:cell division GTPase FtsZ
VVIDDADYLEPGLAVTMIENLIDHHDSRVLVIAAVDLGSDLAAALTSRARSGPTAGRVHRAGADPRMGYQSRAELAGELRPHLTAAQAQQLARRTRTFAEIFAAARSEPLP